MIVYKYCVLFAFKNLIWFRQHILLLIFIFISVICHDNPQESELTPDRFQEWLVQVYSEETVEKLMTRELFEEWWVQVYRTERLGTAWKNFDEWRDIQVSICDGLNYCRG